MTSKIFRSTMLVAVIVLLCSLSLIMGILYRHFTGVQTEQLRDELSLAAIAFEQNGTTFLERVEGERFRLTWVAADGYVLFDTQIAVSDMENHADRQEIREALETGTGSSSRYSATLTERTLYEATRLSDGTVLRISVSLASAGALTLGMFHPVVVILLIAITLSYLLSKRMARRIVDPLNRLDLENPLKNDAYEEITPLLQRINQQHLQINTQLQTLRRKTDEFDQITRNMHEGLVLLNSEGSILHMNPAAEKLFGVHGSSVGKYFLSIERSQQIRTAVNDALDKGHGSTHLERNGREYLLDLSRIESDGNTVGVVLLAFDVTEQRNAERSRREFSANVSHELKTPLQSIIGSAELLESGLVKQEDTSRFVGLIRTEAARLVVLIEDIIRLSQLDEGIQLPTEAVDLLALSEDVASSLQQTADSKQVSIQVSGTSCTVGGIRRLLHEIVYNLCENAVKYNVEGGSVSICIQQQDGHTVLQISDTGIGIPPEHHSRVFERFYRVDKSHSRSTGGTGLGLSIVKHAVQYHKASLALESTPGKGTTVTITF